MADTVLITKSKLDSLANTINTKAGKEGAIDLDEMEKRVNLISSVSSDELIVKGISTASSISYTGNKEITYIQIPNSITVIKDDAFKWCTSLSSITIPKTIKVIGENTFYSCTSLTDVYYGGSNGDWSSITFGTGNDNLKNASIHYI